jgi:hypothetical protein
MALACAAALVTGCAHLGPKTIAVDRFDYSTAIADSWKQQTLLNIVKLRYMDLPVFVDVASIVAGYSMQSGVSVNGTISSDRAVQGNYVASGGQAIYTDRPTITYVPMTGEKFLRGLITPIDPKNIFFMLQSGYAADFLLGLTVESLNARCNCCAKCSLPAPWACAWRRTRPKAQPAWCSFGETTCPLTSRKRRRKSGGCSSCPRIRTNTCSPIRRYAGRRTNWP